jgi:predicted nucleotidyltransferase
LKTVLTKPQRTQRYLEKSRCNTLYKITIPAGRVFQKILEDRPILSQYNLMRISQDEALSICKAIQARDPSATVSLFGSMADDKARGGDIDLLLRSNRLTLSDRLDIACELEDALGLRKIDLVIDNGRPSAFVRSIESRAIRL